MLPPLREELTLYPGPSSRDGAPSWSLHDPSSNRFFRIGWPEFEMLSRWHLGDGEAVARSINEETALQVDADTVDAFLTFLARTNLLRLRGGQAIDNFMTQVAAKRQNWMSWLLHNYLFIRIPLVRPDRFLDATLPFVNWLLGRKFAALVLALSLIAFALVLRQWEAFIATFLYFFSWEGLAYYGAAIVFAKFLHELGHAYTAKRYGCRVPTMGVAFLVLWPVLYTDTSDAWKLPSKRQRLMIGAAGMRVELMLAVFATLAWSFLPDGPTQSAAFVLATTTWVLTLLINLNPFMRFDGYFLMSDLAEIENLQERSFALARWQMRETLFRFGHPPPEETPRARGLLMIAYAYATWIYRLFLFLGIALLVYYMFFRALGVFLFVVEIVYFILRPIFTELRVWYGQREEAGLNRNTILTFAALGLIVAMFFVPWRTTVKAPATMTAASRVTAFAPEPARLVEFNVRPGEEVEKGAVIARFESPDLNHRLAETAREAALFRWQLSNQGFSAEVLDRNQEIAGRLARAESQIHALQERISQLVVAAPIAGRAMDFGENIRVGDWLPRGLPLLTLVAAERATVQGMVGDDALHRIRKGAPALFYADDLDVPPVPLTVSAVDEVNTERLSEPYLASDYGGAVPVRRDSEGRLVAEGSIYRVTLDPGTAPLPRRQVVRGVARIEASRESLALQFWRAASAVFVRERGV